jgi:hypothetical protein
VNKLHHGNLASSTSLPLQVALHLTSDPSGPELPLPLLVDLTTAYPSHRNAIFAIWSNAFACSTPSPGHPDGADSDNEGETVLGDLIQTKFIPSLMTRLQRKASVQDIDIASTMLLGLIRAHDELLAMLLSEADIVLPTLNVAYDTLAPGGKASLGKEVFRVKEAILLFCMELVRAVQSESVRDGLRRLAGVPSDTKSETRAAFLRSNTMGQDLGVLLAASEIDGAVGVDPDTRTILEDIADDEARGDAVSFSAALILSRLIAQRVQAILALFPSLPPFQLLLALNHPSYATSSTSTPEIQASPLLEVILSGGSTLPPELVTLKHAIHAVSEQQGSMSMSSSSAVPEASGSGSASAPAPAPAPKPYIRSNIHDAPLDMSRLTIRSEVDEPTPLALAPGMGKDVSDEMRARIHRLVERQRVEAEELARAIAEAGGQKYRPERREYAEDDVRDEPLLGPMDDEEDTEEAEVGVGSVVKGRLMTRKEGDESGEEENGENVVPVVSASLTYSSRTMNMIADLSRLRRRKRASPKRTRTMSPSRRSSS